MPTPGKVGGGWHPRLHILSKSKKNHTEDTSDDEAIARALAGNVPQELPSDRRRVAGTAGGLTARGRAGASGSRRLDAPLGRRSPALASPAGSPLATPSKAPLEAAAGVSSLRRSRLATPDELQDGASLSPSLTSRSPNIDPSAYGWMVDEGEEASPNLSLQAGPLQPRRSLQAAAGPLQPLPRARSHVLQPRRMAESETDSDHSSGSEAPSADENAAEATAAALVSRRLADGSAVFEQPMEAARATPFPPETAFHTAIATDGGSEAAGLAARLRDFTTEDAAAGTPEGSPLAERVEGAGRAQPAAGGPSAAQAERTLIDESPRERTAAGWGVTLPDPLRGGARPDGHAQGGAPRDGPLRPRPPSSTSAASYPPAPGDEASSTSADGPWDDAHWAEVEAWSQRSAPSLRLSEALLESQREGRVSPFVPRVNSAPTPEEAGWLAARATSEGGTGAGPSPLGAAPLAVPPPVRLADRVPLPRGAAPKAEASAVGPSGVGGRPSSAGAARIPLYPTVAPFDHSDWVAEGRDGGGLVTGVPVGTDEEGQLGTMGAPDLHSRLTPPPQAAWDVAEAPPGTPRPPSAPDSPTSAQGAARARLEQRLKLYDLAERQVQGDGNCQFRALADQLYGDPDKHALVRRMVARRLEKARAVYAPHVPRDYDAYETEMSRDGAWGDHVTLQAAADAYGVRISLVTSFESSDLVEIEPRGGLRSSRVLWLSFWAEFHYNSVWPGSDLPPGMRGAGAGASRGDRAAFPRPQGPVSAARGADPPLGSLSGRRSSRPTSPSSPPHRHANVGKAPKLFGSRRLGKVVTLGLASDETAAQGRTDPGSSHGQAGGAFVR